MRKEKGIDRSYESLFSYGMISRKLADMEFSLQRRILQIVHNSTKKYKIMKKKQKPLVFLEMKFYNKL